MVSTHIHFIVNEADFGLDSPALRLDFSVLAFAVLVTYVLTVLVFWFVAKVWLGEDGQLKGMLVGAAMGVVLFILPALVIPIDAEPAIASVDIGYVSYLLGALPALGATIGYNMQQPAGGEQAKE